MRFKISHPAIQSVDGDIFTAAFAADCMSHACRCLTEGDRQKNDACCQHGADVSLPEKRAILRRASQIASVMRDDRKDPDAWFDERELHVDPEAPEGIVLRTATADLDDDSSGCVFLEHSGPRGCGLHRAALVHGFDPVEVKPRVCRLYPLSWNEGWLGLSADFSRYSCSVQNDATVYRLMRNVIEEIFDAGLVRELDALELRVLRRRLPVVSDPAAVVQDH